MSKPVVIIGFGGHGHVCAASLMAEGRLILAATDLQPSRGKSCWGFPVILDEILLRDFRPDEVELVLGIGTIRPTSAESPLQRIAKSFEERGFRFTGIRHPTSWIAHGANVAPSAQLHAGSIVQPGAEIKEFAIVNTKATIDHDCKIGRFCHIGPGVTLSGNVAVGDGSHLGSGCTVIQGIQIGLASFVAAGATVVKNVGEGEAVRGVPARGFMLRSSNALGSDHS